MSGFALRGKVMAVLAVVPLAASACGGGKSSPATKDAAGDDHVQVAVSNYTNGPFGLPYLVGDKRGIFKKHRIVVDKIVGSAGGGTTVRLLLAGDLAFADSALAATVQAAQQGSALKIVGGGIQDVNDACSVTRKDAPFKTVKDLQGHTIGFTNPGSASEAFIRLMIGKTGIDPKKFKLKATGGLMEGLALLAKGEVDVTSAIGPLCADPRFKVLDTSEFVPQFQQTVTVTSAKLAQEKPDLVKRFLTALNESNAWVRQNPDAAADLLAAHLEQPAQALRPLMKKLIADPAHWDVSLSAQPVNAALTGAGLSGVLKPGEALPWDKILDQSFLPDGVAKVDPAQLTVGAAQ
jgi:NitT/TauT family transport system substrate-binding protein